ncbi:MAG: hypothetical protein F6K58_14765 [Symploca sp. SIO2E9]|nr:hypothetical protein [Symploca sp. SIO2E9]
MPTTERSDQDIPINIEAIDAALAQNINLPDDDQIIEFLLKVLKKQLRQALQVALTLEFSTIPPYLVALYSLEDKSSPAYQIIRSVALEEMLHINLACNLMNAIADGKDDHPKFYGDVDINLLVPINSEDDKKKLTLPINYPDEFLRPILNGPRVQLMAASTELIRQTFMGIEQPLPETDIQIKLLQEQEFDSIGQFYQAIEQLFELCVRVAGDDKNKVFTGNQDWQRTDFYFGSGGGKPIKVTDIDTAKEAIKQIMEQGEGAIPPNTGYDKNQPYGTYNQYGLRSDGTYGPILGTPYQLSHYFKFKAIADGIVPLPSVHPMIPNPSQSKFESAGNEDAKVLNEIFNLCYSLLVKALQDIFSEDNDSYFSVIVTLMQSVFPTLATQLMQTPMYTDGNKTLGPTAGPSFEYDHNYQDSDLDSILNVIKTAISNALNPPNNLSSSTKATLEAVKKAICGITECSSSS